MQIELYCDDCNEPLKITPANVGVHADALNIGVPSHDCPGQPPDWDAIVARKSAKGV